MVDKTQKTNAMRVLDARKVAYRTHFFSAEIHSADGVAQALGIPADQVFKTLVVMPERGRPFLAILPGNAELDLKKLAQVAGEKKLRMATQREAEDLTGLLVGGISALALLNKGFRVYLDDSAREHAQILVSAGQRGINLQLGVDDLIPIIQARVGNISRRAENT